MATACLRRGPHATREIPDGGRRDCQPDAREGQAGPSGKADRPIVPAKPLTPGEGRGLSSSTDATSGESQEIGDEPTNSGLGSEAADGVTGQSEGIAGL